MKMRSILIRALLTFILFISFQDELFCQQGPETPDKKGFSWDKVYTGGNIGLQFGNITLVELSPVIGYQFTDRLSFGAGITYIYLKDNFYKYSTTVYGGRVFSRFIVTENFFTHVEYEMLNLQIFDNLDGKFKRINVPAFYAGLGYRQKIGGNSFLFLMALWNFLESEYSPYQNPVIRGGVSIGL